MLLLWTCVFDISLCSHQSCDHSVAEKYVVGFATQIMNINCIRLEHIKEA